MIFTVALAGFTIRVESLHEEVHTLCGDYLVPDGPADFTVRVSQADIDAERQKSIRQDMAEGRMPTIYPDDYLETLAVYRQIAETMPQRGAFLLHGSAVAVGDRAWIFTAPSGVGKTTHTRLWLDNIQGSYVVNGDKPLIRRRDGGFQACGTPWAGKEGWNRNTAVTLGGVVFLGRGAENRIERAAAGSVFPQLFSQTYRPGNVDAQKKTLALLKTLCSEVPMYTLRCNMENDAALTAFRGVTKDE